VIEKSKFNMSLCTYRWRWNNFTIK